MDNIGTFVVEVTGSVPSKWTPGMQVAAIEAPVRAPWVAYPLTIVNSIAWSMTVGVTPGVGPPIGDAISKRTCVKLCEYGGPSGVPAIAEVSAKVYRMVVQHAGVCAGPVDDTETLASPGRPPIYPADGSVRTNESLDVRASPLLVTTFVGTGKITTISTSGCIPG